MLGNAHTRRLRAYWLGLIVLLSAVNNALSDVRDRERQLLETVKRRLFIHLEAAPGYAQWPPSLELFDDQRVIACASVRVEGTGSQALRFPQVLISTGLMRRVILTESDPEPDTAGDRLAFVVGHELGHHVLRHLLRAAAGGVPGQPCARAPAGSPPLIDHAFTHDQEIAADRKGMELALKANYSCREGLKAIERLIELKLEYTTFEGLREDHPSWRDRLALLEQYLNGKAQATLWRAMSAFHNGAFFLLIEQYAPAERCFLRVTREFPRCHEAWANLGYARLMRYCDNLKVEELRALGVGQIVVAGFCRRPKLLIPNGGTEEKLWQEAVAALTRALELRPDLALPRANLGVAYLVRPGGRDEKLAAKHLKEAATRAAVDEGLDLLTRAAVLVNSGVAELACGCAEESVRRFDQAEDLARRLASGRPLPARLSSALFYNRARVNADTTDAARRRQAMNQLENYLRTSNPASLWWPLAYEQYGKLCKELKAPALGRDELVRVPRLQLRPATGVRLASGAVVNLTDPIGEVRMLVGEVLGEPVAAEIGLTRWRYPEQGIDVLGAEYVMAIFLLGPHAPVLTFASRGLVPTTVELRIGMTLPELEQALVGETALDKLVELAAPDVWYVSYPDLGLAVRVHKLTEKVEELVIVQVARQSP